MEVFSQYGFVCRGLCVYSLHGGLFIAGGGCTALTENCPFWPPLPFAEQSRDLQIYPVIQRTLEGNAAQAVGLFAPVLVTTLGTLQFLANCTNGWLYWLCRSIGLIAAGRLHSLDVPDPEEHLHKFVVAE